MAELVLEILSEEIPARYQARAAAELAARMDKALAEARLGAARIETFATPRRLALIAEGLPERQPDLSEERKGPRIDAPAKAIAGFERATGLSRAAFRVEETPKGAFYVAEIARPGRASAEVLSELVPALIAGFPWPRSMRWGGESRIAWVRPIVSLLCLFDGRPVPVRLPHGIEAGALTRGHRFLAPEPFTVAGADDYKRKLRAAHVVLDAADRRAMIEEEARVLATAEGLRVRDDPALLDENAGMVEWPWVRMGRIDAAFMDLPPEVLITAMRTHQRYFALEDDRGVLAPRFLLVAGVPGEDQGGAIVAGNERVLRARLADARFFWDQDRKRGLAAMRRALDGVVFHARLGSLGDKARRLEALSGELAAYVPDGDEAAAAEAGGLAKADLASEMVGEFPELQGVMGRYYALHEGRSEAVAQAIAEHYAPAGPSDAPPASPTGRAVALADKIDTLVGFFAIDETPTGSKDPFALRRAALGVIRIVVENGIRLPLREAFRSAFANYVEQGIAPLIAAVGEISPVAAFEEGPVKTLLAFIADRLKVALRERGVRHDLIAAVFAAHADDDLVRLLARVAALEAFLASEDGANLLTAYRRAANIVRIEEKRDRVRYVGEVDPALLREPAEIAVAERLFEVAGRAEAALAHEEFAEAMAALARLRAPVDAFFDTVTVNCEDAELRRNRLLLLAQIRAALDRVADFSKIEG